MSRGTEIEIHNGRGVGKVSGGKRKVSRRKEELLILGDQELDASGLDPDVAEVLLAHKAVLGLL